MRAPMKFSSILGALALALAGSAMADVDGADSLRAVQAAKAVEPGLDGQIADACSERGGPAFEFVLAASQPSPWGGARVRIRARTPSDFEVHAYPLGESDGMALLLWRPEPSLGGERARSANGPALPGDGVWIQRHPGGLFSGSVKSSGEARGFQLGYPLAPAPRCG